MKLIVPSTNSTESNREHTGSIATNIRIVTIAADLPVLSLTRETPGDGRPLYNYPCIVPRPLVRWSFLTRLGSCSEKAERVLLCGAVVDVRAVRRRESGSVRPFPRTGESYRGCRGEESTVGGIRHSE
jgi:hypothetical protein